MSEAAAGSPWQEAIPLVVGIVGHTKPEPTHLSAVEATLRRILAPVASKDGAEGGNPAPAGQGPAATWFSGLPTRCPGTPITVLTALAPGADRIGAQVGLLLGHRVVGVLPMTAREYAKALGEDPDTGELADLLKRVHATVVVPRAEGAVRASGADPPAREDRAALYEAASAYLVRHSQILVAVWDMDTTHEERGGTCQAVRFQLNGVPPERAPAHPIVNPLDAGVVLRIACGRGGGPALRHAAGSLRVLFPGDLRGGEGEPPMERQDERFTLYRSMLQGLAEFNADLRRIKAPGANDVARKRRQLVGEVDRSAGTALERLIHRQMQAGALADLRKTQTSRLRYGLYGLVFVAALFFDWFAHVEAHLVAPAEAGGVADFAASVPWFLFLSLVLTFACQRLARRNSSPNRPYERWQKARALAEGLRVQYFWRLTRVPRLAADHYLGHQRSQLDWIGHALRTVDLEFDERADDDPVPVPSRDDLARACEVWVGTQLKFFDERVRDRERALKRRGRFQSCLIASGVGVAAFWGILLTLRPFPWARHVAESHASAATALLAMGLLPLAAGLIRSHTQATAIEEESRQFRRMRELYRSANRRLPDMLAARNETAALNYLHLLGVEALLENG